MNKNIEELKEILEEQWDIFNPIIEVTDAGDYLITSPDNGIAGLHNRRYRGGKVYANVSLPQKEEEIYQELLNLAKEI